MAIVYVVQRVHVSALGDEDTKMIGVFATRQDADAAQTRLGMVPGFRDHLDGFETSEYEVGKVHWMEGFVSWAEAADSSAKGKSE